MRSLKSERRRLVNSPSTKGIWEAVGNDSEEPLEFPFTEGTCQRNLDMMTFSITGPNKVPQGLM